MENLHFKAETSGEYIIREGQALPEVAPNKINIEGDINTVQSFLTHRNGTDDKIGIGRQKVDRNKAVILVDKEKMKIVLKLDPEDYYGGVISGSLQFSEELKAFGINTTKVYKREELVKLIKFSRLYFTNPEKHRELLNAYERFEATVNTEIKNESDNRGNRLALLEKQVKTKLPPEFILAIPVFKGMKHETFRVEIAFDVTDAGVRFWFESVELHELIEERKTEIFDAMVNDWSDFVVVYE